MSNFTHFDAQGNAIMTDVSQKESTQRYAKATGYIKMSRKCYEAIRQGGLKKGDVLGVARLAGIMAVKQVPSIIPLCHSILISKASIDFSELTETSEEYPQITATCTVKTTGATGVEMEALTGVSVALLTIYDMCKAVDRAMEIHGIRLLEKSGGKSGDYRA